MTNNIKFVITRFVFSSSKCIKICFRPGLRPDPLGELTTLPRPPSRLGKGIPPPLPLPIRRLRRLEHSVLRPPQHKIVATPVIVYMYYNTGNPYTATAVKIMAIQDHILYIKNCWFVAHLFIIFYNLQLSVCLRDGNGSSFVTHDSCDTTHSWM